MNDYQVQQRQNRGLSQRLLLKPASLKIIDLHFAVCEVIGSTGKEYSVAVNNGWTTCTCPDFTKHDGAHTCKHIYFFLSRVLQTPETLWRHGTDFSDTQMDHIFQRIHKVLEHCFACETMNSAIVGPRRKKIPQEQSECCICLEEFAESDGIVFCRWQCGYNFHKMCIERCMSATQCPMCRTKL